MTRILIPRSDSVSAKIIEPSDFEKLNTDDIVPDYKKSGLILSGASGLTLHVSAGVARLKGLYIESTAQETVSSLTASDVNYIYITIARDGNSEAESWSFTKNLTGTTPTDSLFIGTATTNGTTVTSVDHGLVKDKAFPKLEFVYFGDGVDGDVTMSTNTNIGEVKHYDNLTINAGVTLTSTASTEATLIFKVKDTLTINGTISMDGRGGTGGVGQTGGGGGAGGSGTWGNNPGSGGVPGRYGIPGKVGGLGQIGNNDTHRLESGTGGSGAGGTGGYMPLGWSNELYFTGGPYATGLHTGAGSADVETNVGGPYANIQKLRNQNTVVGDKYDDIRTPGLANTPNTRLNDPFYISTQLPQFFGGGGSGGTSGRGGYGSTAAAGGSGGGGSGGGTGGNSGAGGNGGGGIIICARNIVIANTGVITADGAAGSAGTNGTNGTAGGYYDVSAGADGGGSGGGGGGEGGQIVLLYETYTNNGSSNITSTGGTGGAHGNAGVTNNTTSEDGSDGGAGTAKTLKQIDLS